MIRLCRWEIIWIMSEPYRCVSIRVSYSPSRELSRVALSICRCSVSHFKVFFIFILFWFVFFLETRHCDHCDIIVDFCYCQWSLGVFMHLSE